MGVNKMSGPEVWELHLTKTVVDTSLLSLLISLMWRDGSIIAERV